MKQPGNFASFPVKGAAVIERKGTVLLRDDEPASLKLLSMALLEEGYEVVASNSVEHARRVICNSDVDAVITDLGLPGSNGMHLFEYVTETRPELPVIFLAGFGAVEDAVRAMARGAFYFFIKPPDCVKLKRILAGAVEQGRLKRAFNILKFGPERSREYRIIGISSAMQRISDALDAVKDSESSVLLCGENGTGKEFIARVLHARSRKNGAPFIAVNCAVIREELSGPELPVGTPAYLPGKFEQAGNGIVFLDEIGDLGLRTQAKLLRLLEHEDAAACANNTRTGGFRLISACSRDLEEMVRTGSFLEDLYCRISGIRITIPPLRDRRDDIPLLAHEFLEEFCTREKKYLRNSQEVIRALRAHDWPGNAKQLRNVIERAVVLARGQKITLRELPHEIFSSKKERMNRSTKTLKELELLAVMETLRKCNGNKSKTAKLLGISRKSFYRRLREASRAGKVYPGDTAERAEV